MNSLVVDSGLTKGEVDLIYAYCIQKAKEPHDFDKQVSGTPSYANDAMMKALHYKLHNTMEKLTELKLFKTYNYWRMYKFGDVLPRHTDRPSCEISTTLHVGHEGEDWSIFIIDDKEREVILKPGEMLVYEGCIQPHWREEYKGGRYAQCFLHFVNADGPNKEWKFDKHEAY